MKNSTSKIVFPFLFSILAVMSYGQYNWKLSKDKDGIKVYESETKNSNFKSIKVECVLPGSYDKLIATLNDVAHQKEWVYSSKISYELTRKSPYDFYYYTETSVPWPISNRDAVIHMTMIRDSLNRFLKISATGVPNYIPEKSGKVRLPKLLINWNVTMPSSSSISIVYTLEAEPGGSVPAWIVNMFADKGPYESFKKLAEVLRR
jgi:hypothetical protein